jgi:AAA domain, putative AbiEii toxin, Type IV TA system
LVYQSSDRASFPTILELEILTPTNRKIKYEYELIVSDNEEVSDSISDEEISFSWNDSCHYLDEKREIIWKTLSGKTTLSDRGIPTILGITSSLRQFNFPKQPQVDLPSEARWIYSVLKGINFIQATPTRYNPFPQTQERKSSFLRISKRGIGFASFGLPDEVSAKIFRMKPETRGELELICQRIGLGEKILVQESSVQKSIVSEQINIESIASVSLDGVNLGLLSDGTIRVLSILIGIIDSSSSSTTIIEEPEVHVHPAMLEKLLNEIESYTHGDNLLMATQSPQVVAWTSPDKINLVHRANGKTIVRTLGELEIQNVMTYLSEEGSLGEWLYGGIVDE